MRFTCLFLWALLPSFATAQTVKMPERVAVGVGRLAAIKIEFDGDDVRWTVPPTIDAFREYDPDPRVVRLRLIAYNAGTYELKAITCKDKKLSEFAVCAVLVGEVPVPPPPPPTPDALTVKIIEALAFETDPDKLQLKGQLAKLYRASMVSTDIKMIETWGDLFTVMGQDAGIFGVKGKLPKVQAVIGAYLSNLLPTDPARSLAGERDKAKAAFAAVAAALDGAK